MSIATRLLRASCQLGLLATLLFLGAGNAWACGCDDGLTGALGCCGGDEERVCSPFSSCSACIAPAELNDLGTNCAVPRQIGDRCSAFFPCSQGLECAAEVFEPALRCRDPNVTDTGAVLPSQACGLLHSEALSDAIRAGPVESVSFGAGLNAEAVASASAEIGVVYGRDGRFGCYYSVCTGFSSNPFPSGFVYANSGLYNSYDNFEGPSGVAGVSASFNVFGVGVGVTVGTVSTLAPAYLGNFFAVGFTGGGPPFPASVEGSIAALACTTDVVTAYTPPLPSDLDPGPNQYLNTNYTGTNPNGHFLQPYKTLETALSPTGTLLAHNFPDLFIEGTQTAPAQGQNTPEDKSDDVPAQMLIQFAPNNGVPNGSGAEYIVDKRVTLHSTKGELTFELVCPPNPSCI